MAQTAWNDHFPISRGIWTEISEIDCTFTVEEGAIEIVASDGAPDPSQSGIRYVKGQGVDVATPMLARFPGASGTPHLWVMARSSAAVLFVSRAAT